MPSTDYVSVGKPKVGGAIFRAPAGTALPNDASSNLATAFKELGYCSDDGVTNENSPDSDTVKAWGGDTVATLQNEKSDTFQFKLIEPLRVDVLKAIYGDSNVIGDLEAGITVKANSAEQMSAVWVIDMILHGDVMKRFVIPNGKISEISEISYKDDEAVGYEITVNAMPGEDGDTHKEYIAKKGA